MNRHNPTPNLPHSMGVRSSPALPEIPLSPAGRLQGRQHVRKSPERGKAGKTPQSIHWEAQSCARSMASPCEPQTAQSSGCTPKTSCDQSPEDSATPGTIPGTPQTGVRVLELIGTSSCWKEGFPRQTAAFSHQKSNSVFDRKSYFPQLTASFHRQQPQPPAGRSSLGLSGRYRER